MDLLRDFLNSQRVARLVVWFKRSRLLQLFVTILVWFLISLLLGMTGWALDETDRPFLAYIYNAFTIFSNLNDDLNLAMSGGVPHLPAMVVNVLLIISGMVGISVLTATVTSSSLNLDEERFDRLIDEFRRLAIVATSRQPEGTEPADAHRILNLIVSRIHNEVLPFRTSRSMHQLNVYEFEYILVNVIDRIIASRDLLSDPAPAFAVHDADRIERIVQWVRSLDGLHAHLSDPAASPVSLAFRQAWRRFSVDFYQKALAARLAGAADGGTVRVDAGLLPGRTQAA
jgi:hypothetical protein